MGMYGSVLIITTILDAYMDIMNCSGKQETYEANEMALTDIRRVEELLAKNVAEEREPQILNDMDIELADEEEI